MIMIQELLGILLIVGRNHCTHALIVSVRLSVSRLYHETHGNYSFPARALVP